MITEYKKNVNDHASESEENFPSNIFSPTTKFHVYELKTPKLETLISLHV